MATLALQRTIEELESSSLPAIKIIKRAEHAGINLGIFASSFNPVTNAHIELIKAAAERFALDEVLALAGTSNADKDGYECPLIDRIEMLYLALASLPRISIGLTSTAFFVDMIAALDSVYPFETSYSFIVGFDTFIRVLDRDGKYVARYYTRFQHRNAALKYLLERARLIVAERGPLGESGFIELLEAERSATPKAADDSLSERVRFMSFPSDFSERSATEVRERLRSGIDIARLVPCPVVDYISQHGLYSKGRTE
ncbi:MAG: nicotinate-nicotinamide nucleotide adenylyltransferase [Blastocatellia bacterium]